MLKVLDEACTPTKGSKFSACIDLRASEDVVIGAGETKMVGLGVCIDLELLRKEREKALGVSIKMSNIEFLCKSHYLQLNPRSSLRAKGLISNSGIVDLDYRDEIKIIIHNPVQKIYSDMDNHITVGEYFEIKKGDRIAQITLLEHKAYLFGVETEEERCGGFGSTNDTNDNNEEDGRNL